jgi:hypothetical protein
MLLNKNPVIWLLGLLILCLLSFSPVSSAQDEIIYDAEGRRDPFMALVTRDGRLINLEPAEDEAKIILGGIIYVENGISYAIINNEVLGVGDYILGYTVLSIDENKVVLIKDGEKVDCVLEKEEL